MATAAVKPTQYQESSIGFAEDIAPFARKLLGTAELYTDLEENPYQQYMRDRQAQFTPLQQQSFENAGLMQTAPQLGDATAMAGMAGLGALNTQYTFNPYQTQQFTGANVQQYMSPYMQNVVDIPQPTRRARPSTVANAFLEDQVLFALLLTGQTNPQWWVLVLLLCTQAVPTTPNGRRLCANCRFLFEENCAVL